MHADRVGDLAQRQRHDRLVAAFEEAALALDQHLRRAQQGVVAHRQAAYQPARLVEHPAQHGVVAGLARRERALAMRGDADARRGAAVERDAPGAAGMPGDHVGDDVQILDLDRGLDRRRTQAQDQRDRGVHLGRIGMQYGRERGVVVHGEQIDVIGEDVHRQLAGGAAGQRRELRAQALAGVARGHAGPVAVQQALAHDFELAGLVRERQRGERGQLNQGLFEITAVVAVVQPPRRALQVALVPVLRELPQQAHAGVAGHLVGDAQGRVLTVAVATAAGSTRQECGVGQFVPRRRLERRALGVVDRFGLVGVVLVFEQRIALQRLAQFLLQLRRGELQQADRLQQLRRQVDALDQVGADGGFQDRDPRSTSG